MPTQPEDINGLITEFLDHHKIHKPNSIPSARQTIVYLKVQSCKFYGYPAPSWPRHMGTWRLLGMMKADSQEDKNDKV